MREWLDANHTHMVAYDGYKFDRWVILNKDEWQPGTTRLFHRTPLPENWVVVCMGQS